MDIKEPVKELRTTGIYDETIFNDIMYDTQNLEDNENDLEESDNIYTFNDPRYKRIIDIYINQRNIDEYNLINKSDQERIIQEIYLQPSQYQYNFYYDPISQIFSSFNMLMNNSNFNGPNVNYISYSNPNSTFYYSSNIFPFQFESISQNYNSSNTNNSHINNNHNIFDFVLNNLSNIINIVNNQEPIPVTLTENALKKIKKMDLSQLKEKVKNITEEDQCSICLGKLLEEEDDKKEFTILPCEHYFHYECIIEQLKNYDYHCPICRKEVGEHKPKL